MKTIIRTYEEQKAATRPNVFRNRKKYQRKFSLWPTKVVIIKTIPLKDSKGDHILDSSDKPIEAISTEEKWLWLWWLF